MGTRNEGREARMSAVRQAAWALFAGQGYESTTVRQIAVKAGVSTGTVMSLGDKATLLLGLFEAAIAEHMSPSRHEDDSAAEAVWRCYEPYFDFYASHPELSRAYGRVLLSPAGRNHPALGAQAQEFNALVARKIAAGYPQASESAAGLTAESLFASYIHALVIWASETTSLDQARSSFRRQITWQLARFEEPHF
ncbi:TetR/AcrR family transcriptional regulator [Saxibacter everestensis]|uniref:TetR/AcrR family transcriptional regulator n=1 Tax=Saxibacter everestensis TaxID=2909229 RepID=A0ABY8QV32_9MICO|nr:TetR/AcrR family transcriptional regulator [Brevibacteriaceae bacterium ZFBP1038]